MQYEHHCDQCFEPMSDHQDRCYDDTHEDEPGSFGYHFPPLCCPGCGCQSYEEAHDLPENLGTLDGAYY